MVKALRIAAAPGSLLTYTKTSSHGGHVSPAWLIEQRNTGYEK
jgi:hypothetical protein